MKKGYFLLVAGLIPLLFLVYVYRFFANDERKKNLETARLYNSETASSLKKGDLVLITGKLSTKQPIIEVDLGFLQEEEKVKEKDRSVWTQKKNYTNSMLVDLENGTIAELELAQGYVLCGRLVQVLPIADKDPKKFRKLGVKIGEPITGYGEILELSPLKIHAAYSPCAEPLVEYQSSVNLTSKSYMLLFLFISVPSLFLIYLGIFNKD